MKLLTILVMLACLPVVALSQQKPKSEKQRLIYPVEITINAPAAKVRSLVMTGYLRDGYQLDSETVSSVTFSHRGGLQHVFAYGSLAKVQTTLTFVETDGVTLVIADMGTLSPNRFGGQERFNRNSDKTSRKAIESFLLEIKQQAEGASAPAALPPVKNPEKEPTTTSIQPPSPPRKSCYEGGVKVPCP